MDVGLITILMLGSVVALLALGLPVAFAIGSVAMIFTVLFWEPTALYSVASFTFGTMDSFVLIAAPLFIFMGCVLQTSGIADDLYTMMYRWMGPIRGGLAMGTVGICTVFAAMAGVSAAGTVTMGTVSLPEMLKRDYNRNIAIGSILGGGALGILIPPSMPMILYGSLTGVSVGKLFMGGIIPGLTLATLFVVFIGVRCTLRKDLGPPLALDERAGWSLKFASLKAIILPALIIVAVLGSIYTGIATPTEAAAVGVLGAVISSLVYRRFTWERLKQATNTTLRLSAMIFWIVIAASWLRAVYASVGGAQFVEAAMSTLPFGKYGVLIGIQIIVLVMGMFLESVGITMLAIPIFLPVVLALGIDPLWFGIIFVVNLEMSYLTPPVGFNLFFMRAVCPEWITMGDIYRSAWPIVLIQLTGLALVIALPQMALYLPSLMGR